MEATLCSGATMCAVTTMMSSTERSVSRVVRNSAPQMGMSLSSGKPVRVEVVLLR